MRLGRSDDGFRGSRQIALRPFGHLADVSFHLAPNDRFDPGNFIVHGIFPF
jgi:hypothetical protein